MILLTFYIRFWRLLIIGVGFRAGSTQPTFYLKEALTDYCQGQQHRYFCTARENVPLFASILPSQLTINDSLVVATGCEGGWTEEEIKQAQKAQFQLVSLGRRILRAVTAPITVMSLVAGVSETMS